MTRARLWSAIEVLAACVIGAACGIDSSSEGRHEDDAGIELASFAHDLRTSPGSSSAPLITPWPTGLITYALDDDAAPVPRSDFHAEVAAAMAEWSRVTKNRVLFLEVPELADAQIVIGFRSVDHRGHGECADEFSGPETIAHVFTYDQDCFAGVIHLNRELPWSTERAGRYGTYDLRYAALHEVGHLLGLGHSPHEGHIMSPTYIGVVRALTSEEGADASAVLDGSAP